MKTIQLKGIAAAAFILLILSGIWLWTGMQSWKGVMLERGFEQDRNLSSVTLKQAWESSRDLPDMFLPGRHVHYPGLAAQLLILDEGIDLQKRAQVLLQGREGMYTALAREPAHAHAWARLAWVEHMLQGPSPEAVSALAMSMYAAPADRSLVYWRISMSAANETYWDPGFESILRRQMIHAWRISPDRLARTVVETDMVEKSRQALAAAREDLERFDQLIARHRD